jgi:hypothetical protein
VARLTGRRALAGIAPRTSKRHVLRTAGNHEHLMALETAEELRAAATVGWHFHAPGVTLIASPPDKGWLYQSGWSLALGEAVVVPAPELDPDFSFVYRPLNRLRAGRGLL